VDGGGADAAHLVSIMGRPGDRSTEDDDVREVTRRSQQRETGNGSGRQLAAAVGERDRTADLRRLSVPLVAGPGHDLARRFRPDLLDGIERTAARPRHRL
jgi:hypothetical protein